MPNVKQAVHLGIIRTNTLAYNITVNAEENIKKSRGFHGNNINGLDPETLLSEYIYLTHT
jgi:hypothetical protein